MIPTMPHKLSTSLFTVLLALGLAAPAHAGSMFGRHSSITIGDGPVITGSGHIVSQPRQTGGFDAVQTKGAVDLDIVIGAQTAVTVDMDDNLQPLIRTEVHGQTLVIDSTGSWTADHDPRVHITLPALTALAMQDSGDAALKGLNGGDLALRISGSGDIDASGQIASLEVLLDGSGDARLDSLRTADARVRVNGSGDVSLNVTQTLEASVYGSGDIRYRGDAKVISHVHGSGSVKMK